MTRSGRALRRPPRAFLLAVLVLAGWGPGACQRRAPAPAAPDAPCAAVEGSLPAGARADGLAGEFRLTLVATSGPRAGRSTSGALHLRRYADGAGPAANAGARYPLYGGAEVSPDSVGAIAAGDVRSTAAAAPGVLVLEWRRSGAPADRNEITLRFGAEANRSPALRFDGAYLALHVAELSADRFAGRWVSGVAQQQAAGYFCAVRAGASG